jgi:hypothetical protein
MVRAGKSQAVQLPVSSEHPTLVADLQGSYPSYFVYGPMVFSPATWQLVSNLEGNSGLMRMLGLVKSPLVTRPLDPPSDELQELVVVSSPFFPNKLVNGYSNPAGSVVYSVNGTRIKSLAHLVAVLRDLKDPVRHLRIRSEGRRSVGVLAAGHLGGHRRCADRQRSAGPGLAGHAGGVAGRSDADRGSGELRSGRACECRTRPFPYRRIRSDRCRSGPPYEVSCRGRSTTSRWPERSAPLQCPSPRTSTDWSWSGCCRRPINRCR